MRKFTLLLCMLVLSVLAFAQRTVTGTVRDDKGEIIPFATVSEVGKKNSVRADANGVFSIKAADGAKLQITSSGHQDQTVTVSGTTVNAVLVTRSEQLSEVVVTTALGVQRQARELGYSTAKVRASELTQSKAVNITNGLTGKVSGLTIQQTNNGVFGDNRITLRGIRSLTGNNQPMLVLDGVPVSLGFINSLNPNDVADVTILKSASSTAIYGPEGVNGAIVITTKKGVKGRPQVTVSHTIQLEKISYFPKLQSQFGSGSSIDANGNGIYDPIENQGYGDAFDGSLRQIGRTAPDGSQYQVTYVARPDEKSKFFNTGVTNQTDVSFATGDFYLSAQNVGIRGIIPGDENNRRNFRLRSEKEYNNFKASFNVNYTRSDYNITTQPDRDHSPYWLLINTPMEIPITQFKNWRSNYWASPNGYFNDYYSNPYFIIDNYRTKGSSDDLYGNVELNYKLFQGVNITYRISESMSNSLAKSTRGSFTYSDFAKSSGKNIAASGDLNASVADVTNNSNRLTSELFLTMSKKVKDFKFDVLLGQSFRQITSKATGISSNNLGQSTTYNVVLRKGEPTVSEGDSKQRLERFFGRVGVGYKDWAFLEGTASYDIDSRLANPFQVISYDKIGFFYPGVNASILLNQVIPALKNSNVFSYAKIRGAISKTGNVNLGAYNLENTYGLSTFFPYGTTLGFGSTGTLVQPNYKPEFVNNKEVGLELGFLKNRINLEANAYTQDNTDQIINVAYSATTGFNRSLLNAASFTNKGLEFDLKLTPLIKIGKLSVDVKANYTYQTNKITKIIEGVDQLGVGNANFAIVGMPAFVFKLTDYVRDAQGHVIVDRNTGMPKTDPNTKVFGNTLPNNILGLSMNLNWKGLTVSAVADYRSGNQIYSGNLGNALDFSGISQRSALNSRRAFVFPNSVYDDGTGKLVTNTNVYTQSYGYNFFSQDVNTGVQSNYLSSGSFWKLREVAISYTIPMKVFGSGVNNYIKGVTVSLNGRDLYTWLPKTNQWTDPEFSNSSSSNGQGVSDLYNTPPTRKFGATLQVQF